MLGIDSLWISIGLQELLLIALRPHHVKEVARHADVILGVGKAETSIQAILLPGNLVAEESLQKAACLNFAHDKCLLSAGILPICAALCDSSLRARRPWLCGALQVCEAVLVVPCLSGRI